MKRVIVIGCPGSGKTTFAEKLRDRLALPLYYLDAIWHKPDRTHIPREAFDERLGEIAAAVIELKPDAVCTEDDINEFCMALPRYKRPKKIIFADVPRNPTGKIEKPRLREIYCGKRLVEAQTTR